MTTIRVGLGDRSYPIVIEPDLLARAGEHLAPFVRNDRLVVVTDANVERHLPTLAQSLAGVRVNPVVLAAGEAAKSWAGLEQLVEALLALNVERSETVVALGGGVIGDLVGFAAAILKRGCGVVQVPTTLLAQVDSSVGGKTAINAKAGKNLVGVFHQPRLVLIDPLVLETLPERERRAGYAEIVKYGLIDDAAFFDWCEEHGDAVLALDPVAVAQAVATSVRAKARIVAADERETEDVRALLNLGHTFAHALEAETGFSDRLLHGEAVAAGMAIAFRFSAERGLCSPVEAERVERHLAGVGLPVNARGAGVAASGSLLLAHMQQDKKRSGGVLPFILARGIGRAFVARDVQAAEVIAFLDRDRASAKAASTAS